MSGDVEREEGRKVITAKNGLSRAGKTLVLVSALCLACAPILAACGEEGTAVDTTAGTAPSVEETVTSLEGTETTAAAAEGVDASLVGTWHSDQTGETMEFTADGRLIVTSSGGAVTEMEYTADGSNISYLIAGAVVYTGTYSVDGDVLSQVDPDIAGTVLFDRVD
jgi:hypothetical protein